MQRNFGELETAVLGAIPKILPIEFEEGIGVPTLERQIEMYTAKVKVFLEIAARLKRGQLR